MRYQAMAIIMENLGGRKMIKLSVDDVISVVREYQRVVGRVDNYEDTRFALAGELFFLPEEV